MIDWILQHGRFIGLVVTWWLCVAVALTLPWGVFIITSRFGRGGSVFIFVITALLISLSPLIPPSFKKSLSFQERLPFPLDLRVPESGVLMPRLFTRREASYFQDSFLGSRAVHPAGRIHYRSIPITIFLAVVMVGGGGISLWRQRSRTLRVEREISWELSDSLISPDSADGESFAAASVPVPVYFSRVRRQLIFHIGLQSPGRRRRMLRSFLQDSALFQGRRIIRVCDGVLWVHSLLFWFNPIVVMGTNRARLQLLTLCDHVALSKRDVDVDLLQEMEDFGEEFAIPGSREESCFRQRSELLRARFCEGANGGLRVIVSCFLLLSIVASFYWCAPSSWQSLQQNLRSTVWVPVASTSVIQGQMHIPWVRLKREEDVAGKLLGEGASPQDFRLANGCILTVRWTGGNGDRIEQEPTINPIGSCGIRLVQGATESKEPLIVTFSINGTADFSLRGQAADRSFGGGLEDGESIRLISDKGDWFITNLGWRLLGEVEGAGTSEVRLSGAGDRTKTDAASYLAEVVGASEVTIEYMQSKDLNEAIAIGIDHFIPD